MSNSVAEAYLLIVRESLVPVFGEAVPIPFTGQIELDSWSWELNNDVVAADKKRKADAKEALDKAKATKGAAAKGAAGKDKPPPFKGGELIKAVNDMQIKKGVAQLERDKKVRELIKKAVADHEGATDDGSTEEKKEETYGKMKLRFDKGADLATTQLLNAMAKNDVMPRAVLTLFHRSHNAPVTLAITMGNVRLTSYKVSCDPDDKMADVKEEWEATYETLDWMYQNRPAATGPNFVTQGTVRLFKMKTKIPF